MTVVFNSRLHDTSSLQVHYKSAYHKPDRSVVAHLRCYLACGNRFSEPISPSAFDAYIGTVRILKQNTVKLSDGLQ